MPGYWRVSPRIWTEPWSEDARTLALYLLTNEHRELEGLYRIPKGYILEDLKWTPERLGKAFVELLPKPFAEPPSEGFCEYDEKTGVVFIKKALKHQRPENPNQEKHAMALLDELPSTPLLASLYNAAEQFAKPFAKRLGERFGQGFGKPPPPPPPPSTPPAPIASSKVLLVPPTAPCGNVENGDEATCMQSGQEAEDQDENPPAVLSPPPPPPAKDETGGLQQISQATSTRTKNPRPRERPPKASPGNDQDAAEIAKYLIEWFTAEGKTLSDHQIAGLIERGLTLQGAHQVGGLWDKLVRSGKVRDPTAYAFTLLDTEVTATKGCVGA